MFISQLSERVELPAHTIRYYEKIGLISPPKRSETQYRLYCDEDEARLKFIKQAKLFGFSLDEIKEIITLRAEGIAPCLPPQVFHDFHAFLYGGNKMGGAFPAYRTVFG